MRWLFPDDSMIFSVGAPGTPIYSTFNDSLAIYVDAGGVVPADILHVDQTPVYNSIIELDGSSNIPMFYGPDNVKTLYAQDIKKHGAVFEIHALSADRLSVIEQNLAQLGVDFSPVVLTVNHMIPDPVTGNLTLTAADLGALTPGYGDLRYVPYFYFVQSSPASSWTIVHNLGKYPAINLIDQTGHRSWPDAEYVNLNVIVLTFPYPQSGSVSLT